MKTTVLVFAFLLVFSGLTSVQAKDYDEVDFGSSVGVRLTWTAPGDDGNYGRAKTYDLRYSTSPITDSSWQEAYQFIGEPRTAAAGTIQSCFISGLIARTKYYFAIKTVDEAGNWSILSNVTWKIAQEIQCGDVTADGLVNVGDVICLENYVFNGGFVPGGLNIGDVNCDGSLNVSDIVYLTNFVFHPGSPYPCAKCP